MIDQEIAVFLRNLSVSDAQPPTPCFINKFPGICAIRVFEGATASASAEGWLSALALEISFILARISSGFPWEAEKPP